MRHVLLCLRPEWVVRPLAQQCLPLLDRAVELAQLQVGASDAVLCRRPAIVLGHGFGVLKQSLVAAGEYFSRAGYLTLSIDYRTFGESAGEPRGQLFPLRQVEDFRNAISYLQTRPDVDADAIGIWGASFGGAVVIWTAAVDRRVQAVVDPQLMQRLLQGVTPQELGDFVNAVVAAVERPDQRPLCQR